MNLAKRPPMSLMTKQRTFWKPTCPRKTDPWNMKSPFQLVPLGYHEPSWPIKICLLCFRPEDPDNQTNLIKAVAMKGFVALGKKAWPRNLQRNMLQNRSHTGQTHMPTPFLSWELLLVACFFPMCCSCRMLSCCHARIKQIPRNNGKRSTLHPGDTNSHSQPRNTSDNTYWSCSECHALHLPFPSLMLGLPGRMERMEVALVWKCDLPCAIMLCG